MSDNTDPTMHPKVRDFTGTTAKTAYALLAIVLVVAFVFVLFKSNDSSSVSIGEERPTLPVVVPTGNAKTKFEETIGRVLSPENGATRRPTNPNISKGEVRAKFDAIKEGKPDFFNLPATDLNKAKIFNDFELAEFKRALESRVTGMLQGGTLSSGGSQPRTSSSFDTQSTRKPSTPAPNDLEERIALAQKNLSAAQNAAAQSSSPNLLGGSPQASGRALVGTNSTFNAAPPKGSYTVPAGSVINLLLVNGASSDNPGTVLARISRDVYDSTGRYVLIPAYSTVVSRAVRIDSKVNPVLNNQLGVIPSSIQRADGLTVSLADASLSNEDGSPNLNGSVNSHLLPRALATVGYFGSNLGVLKYIFDETNGRNTDVTVVNNSGTEQPAETTPQGGVVVNNTTDRNDDFSEVVVEEIAPQLEETIDKIFSPWMDLKKTISIKPTQKATLILTADLYISPYTDSYEKFIN